MNSKLFPYFLWKILVVASSSVMLTACGTPTQDDFEKEIVEKINTGIPVQKAIANLTNLEFSCVEHAEKFECSRLKQKVVPPVTCVEKLSFIKDSKSLVSDISIEKIACAGL